MKVILSQSVYKAPGVGMDASTIKYLAFFRVISYLKIVRVAKVIEATKKLNGTVRKKIIKKSRKIAELIEKRRGSNIAKSRRNNKLDQDKDAQFAMKYLTDLDKYKGEIEFAQIKNSSNILISGRKPKITNDGSPNKFSPNRTKRDKVVVLKNTGNKFFSIFRKGMQKNITATSTDAVEKTKFNLNPFSLLLRRTIFPGVDQVQASEPNQSDNQTNKDQPSTNPILQALKRKNFFTKKGSKGATINDRLNILKLKKAGSILPESPGKEGRGSRATDFIIKSLDRFLPKNSSDDNEEKADQPVLPSVSNDKINPKPPGTSMSFLSILNKKKAGFLKQEATIIDDLAEENVPAAKKSCESNIFPTKIEETAKAQSKDDSSSPVKPASDLLEFYSLIDSKINEKLSKFKNLDYRAGSNIPEVIAEEAENEPNDSKVEIKRAKMHKKRGKFQSGKNFNIHKDKSIYANQSKRRKSMELLPESFAVKAKKLLNITKEERKVKLKLNFLAKRPDKPVNTENTFKLQFTQSSINSAKSRNNESIINFDHQRESSSSSSSSSTQNKPCEDAIKPPQSNNNFENFRKLENLKKETLVEDSIYSTQNLRSVSKIENEQSKKFLPEKLTKEIVKSFEDSQEEPKKNEDDIDKLNTETALLPPSTNRGFIKKGNRDRFVSNHNNIKAHGLCKEEEYNRLSHMDTDEIDYHNVEDLDDEEEEHEHKGKKYEKLLIESLLNKSLTLKLVSLIMGIIIMLQITNPNYIQDLSLWNDTDKIDFCLSAFNRSMEKVINHTKFINDDSDPELISYLHSLNQTITLCFGYLKEIPASFDDSSWSGRRLSSDSYNISLGDSELDDDQQLFDFLVVNMTMCIECQYIQTTYSDKIWLPSVISSLKYVENHGMTLNIDYYYKNYPIQESKSYIECLVDLHYVSFLDKLMNLLRSLFVTIVLILVSHMLNTDIRSKVVLMVLKLIKKFRYFFHSSSQDYFSLLMNEDIREEEVILYRKLGMFSYMFDISCGKRLLGVLSQSDILNLPTSFDFKKEGVSFEGTLLLINFKSRTGSLHKCMAEISRIYTVIHSLAYGFGGEVVNENKIIWKNKEFLFDSECKKYCGRISKTLII